MHAQKIKEDCNKKKKINKDESCESLSWHLRDSLQCIYVYKTHTTRPIIQLFYIIIGTALENLTNLWKIIHINNRYKKREYEHDNGKMPNFTHESSRTHSNLIIF